MENKKLFLKEVRKGMGGRKSEACKIRRSDGVIVGKNEEMREVWKSHFEKVMNESLGGRAEVTAVGMLIREERPHTQGRLEQTEVMEGIRTLKLGKAPGSDGVTGEMLKYGGEIQTPPAIHGLTIRVYGDRVFATPPPKAGENSRIRGV